MKKYKPYIRALKGLGITLKFFFKNISKSEEFLKRGEYEKARLFLRGITIRVNQSFVRNIIVIGKDNIPEEPVLFVSNHQSNLDITSIYETINGKVTYVAKKELFKIPIVGRAMKLCNVVSMKRNDPKDGIRAINEAVKLIENEKFSVVIFPEGSRSSDGNLQEFKPGSFKIATKSKCKIVPITVDGSFDILKKGSLKIRNSDIKLTFHKPINSINSDGKAIATNKLAEESKKYIESALNSK